ncbi:MAG: thiolase domain-containing protein [Anaerolineaceae bacterium]|nr:thiolase domain-containing protein [Anaerolineaceae bacterium]
MSEIVIVGLGQTPVGEHWETSLRNLATQAIQAARVDGGGLAPQALYIGNMLASTISHQANLGSLLADQAGLTGIEGTTVEAAGASGGAALRLGYLAVLSGMVDVAMVVGVEKYTDQLPAEALAAYAQMLDSDFESVQGITPAAQSALLMQRYLHDYHVEHGCFAGFSLVAHANAANNPNAMYRRAISREAYDQAEPVVDPLNVYDMASQADGAAAVLLTRSELVPKGLDHEPVRITGSSIVTDTLALHDRPDPLALHAAGFSVERACSQAGILPKDIDLFELYDSFSIYSALSLEAAGFAPRGGGWRLAENGQIRLTGEIPIATMGGLKGRGDPVGATGVYQAVEACLQLRGEAGMNQVEGARRALVQSLGGPAATAVAHVLEKMA